MIHYLLKEIEYMAREVKIDDCVAEIARFFRQYYRYCQAPEPDAVREVLASAYSVNDKLRKAGYSNFFDYDEFTAIKAIRNYAIHQAEIHNESKALPLITTSLIKADINILCLLPTNVVTNICENSSKESATAIKNTCIFYKNYVDIYPCFFNFGVRLFLYIEEKNLEISSKEFSNLKNSIEYERKNGYPHFVSGGIALADGTDVDDFLEKNLTTLKERNEMQNSLYTEKNGMYTLNGFEE
jgi:hypothetical protein